MLHPDWKGFSHHDVAVRWWSAYVCHAFPCHADENSLTTRLSDLADCDIKGPAIRVATPPTLDHTSDYTTPRSPAVPAYCRVKNYSKEAMHQIFGEMNDGASKDTELEMGLTQTTYDPDTTNDDDDHDHSRSGKGGGGVCNLFEESLKQMSNSNSTALLEDAMRDVERDFRAIASLLPVVDKPERDTACATISSILLQLRAAAAQTNQKKRKSQTEGTQGIVQERHHTTRRTYNTHQPFYH